MSFGLIAANKLPSINAVRHTFPPIYFLNPPLCCFGWLSIALFSTRDTPLIPFTEEVAGRLSHLNGGSSLMEPSGKIWLFLICRDNLSRLIIIVLREEAVRPHFNHSERQIEWWNSRRKCYKMYLSEVSFWVNSGISGLPSYQLVHPLLNVK